MKKPSILNIVFLAVFILFAGFSIFSQLQKGEVSFNGFCLKKQKEKYVLDYSYILKVYQNRDLMVILDKEIVKESICSSCLEMVTFSYLSKSNFNPFIQETVQVEENPIKQQFTLKRMGTYLINVRFLLSEKAELRPEKFKNIKNGIKLVYKTNNENKNFYTKLDYFKINFLFICFYSVFHYFFVLKNSIIVRLIFAVKFLKEGVASFGKIKSQDNFEVIDFAEKLIHYYNKDDMNNVKSPKQKEAFNKIISGLRGISSLNKKGKLSVLCLPIEFILKKWFDILHLQNAVDETTTFRDELENSGINPSERHCVRRIFDPVVKLDSLSNSLNKYFGLISNMIAVGGAIGMGVFLKESEIILPILYAYFSLNILSLFFLLIHLKNKKIRSNKDLDF